MRKISYAGYRFPPEVIHQAIWLYLRFTLSFRDVEDLLAERGIAVSYETVRRWVNHFGPMIAEHLRKRRPKPHATWHLDEVYLKIDGRMVYLWRAVDAEGEVLDVLVQSKRNKHAALKLMRKLLKKYAFVPERLVTDDLRSYAAAARDLGVEHLHERGRWKNNRAENSHQPTRRRGAQDATFQERLLRAEIPLSLRRRVQHFQCPTPSHVSSIAPRAPRRGDEHVARGRRGRMKVRTPYRPLALFAWQRDNAVAYTVPDTPYASITPGQTGIKFVPINRMTPRSFITNIKAGATIAAGASASARGVAFGGDTWVAKVEFSADAGKSWQSATLGKDEGKYSFRQWAINFTLRESAPMSSWCAARTTMV